MKRNKGFTLIELLVTMTVVVVLLAAGVPSFREFVKNNQVSGEAASLIIAMQVARSEAIKRGLVTVICASTDQATCSESNNWATGWISFTDLDQDGDLDGTGICTSEADRLSRECILRTNTALDNVTVSAVNEDSNSITKVSFRPTGQARSADLDRDENNPPVFIKLKAVDCERKQAREITLKRQGHISSAHRTCS